MARQERMAQKALCGRCGLGKIYPAPHAHLNARSALDGSQVCSECKVEEVYGMFLEGKENHDTN